MVARAKRMADLDLAGTRVLMEVRDAAAAILTRIDCSRLRHILAAHLSKENNRPELAVRALAGALGCKESWVGVSTQDEGFAWRSV